MRAGLLAMCAVPEGPRPGLCVLDMDMCVWRPEMYELDEIPVRTLEGDLNGRGRGIRSVFSGPREITMFDGALAALQEYHDGLHPGMRLAVASSADTPLAVQIGRAAMEVLEVLPGVTLLEVLTKGWEDERNLQIGRTPPLSAQKHLTHFPILREATGYSYDQMLFYDDSNWSDNCGLVETHCKGVVTQRTPRGMGAAEWRAGLEKYARVAREREAAADR